MTEELSHKEMSKRGGRSTVSKYGKSHMSEIGKFGSLMRWARYKARKRLQEAGLLTK